MKDATIAYGTAASGEKGYVIHSVVSARLFIAPKESAETTAAKRRAGHRRAVLRRIA